MADANEVKQSLPVESDLDKELKQAELESKRETLVKLKRENAEARQKSADKQRAESKLQGVEQRRELKKKVERNICNHKQGGEDEAGLVQGDDNNFAINDEVTLLNENEYRCTRCDAVWTRANSWNKKLYGYTYQEVSKLPHKGFRKAVPITFTIPGVNAPLPEGWQLNKTTKVPELMDGWELATDPETELPITRRIGDTEAVEV